ncbi:SGNH/GDSL hydrolase family protein [Pedobacter sp.]
MNKELSYLAIGDSYTIGEAVEQVESFPYQLVELLRKKGVRVANTKVIAKTGWTTDELALAIEQENISQTFDLVTLLIGVNNQYRGYSAENYRIEFKQLLHSAIAFANEKSNNVYVLAIPDWAYTNFAKKSDRDLSKISQEIDAFNEINCYETAMCGATYIDITPISRRANQDVSLIALDELHPSGKMYAEWAKLLAEQIIRA